jgi:hypothetical protein
MKYDGTLWLAVSRLQNATTQLVLIDLSSLGRPRKVVQLLLCRLLPNTFISSFSTAVFEVALHF